MKKLGLITLLFILCSFGQAVHADTSRNQIFTLLEEAFYAQLSLTEDYRTMEEIESILSPYFTDEYIELFLEEHLSEDENGYIILGSDTFYYVVPFFSYDKTTKLIQKGDKMIVYEYFAPFYEGGVVWEGHFEGLSLLNNDGWKISHYYNDTVKPQLKQSFETNNES